MIKRVVCAAAVAWWAVPALAGDAPGEAPGKTPAPKEKMVCSYAASTGSHLKKRTCVTESEHKARRERDQQRMQEIEARRTGAGPGSTRH